MAAGGGGSNMSSARNSTNVDSSAQQQLPHHHGGGGFHRSGIRIDLPKALKDIPTDAIRAAFNSDASCIRDIRHCYTLKKEPFVYVNFKAESPQGLEARLRGKSIGIMHRGQRHEVFVFDERTMGVKMQIAEPLFTLKDTDLRMALLNSYPMAVDAAVRHQINDGTTHVFVNFRSPADADAARARGEVTIETPLLPGQHKVRALPKLNYSWHNNGGGTGGMGNAGYNHGSANGAGGKEGGSTSPSAGAGGLVTTGVASPPPNSAWGKRRHQGASATGGQGGNRNAANRPPSSSGIATPPNGPALTASSPQSTSFVDVPEVASAVAAEPGVAPLPQESVSAQSTDGGYDRELSELSEDPASATGFAGSESVEPADVSAVPEEAEEVAETAAEVVESVEVDEAEEFDAAEEVEDEVQDAEAEIEYDAVAEEEAEDYGTEKSEKDDAYETEGMEEQVQSTDDTRFQAGFQQHQYQQGEVAAHDGQQTFQQGSQYGQQQYNVGYQQSYRGGPGGPSGKGRGPMTGRNGKDAGDGSTRPMTTMGPPGLTGEQGSGPTLRANAAEFIPSQKPTVWIPPQKQHNPMHHQQQLNPTNGPPPPHNLGAPMPPPMHGMPHPMQHQHHHTQHHNHHHPHSQLPQHPHSHPGAIPPPPLNHGHGQMHVHPGGPHPLPLQQQPLPPPGAAGGMQNLTAPGPAAAGNATPAAGTAGVGTTGTQGLGVQPPHLPTTLGLRIPADLIDPISGSDFLEMYPTASRVCIVTVLSTSQLASGQYAHLPLAVQPTLGLAGSPAGMAGSVIQGASAEDAKSNRTSQITFATGGDAAKPDEEGGNATGGAQSAPSQGEAFGAGGAPTGFMPPPGMHQNVPPMHMQGHQVEPHFGAAHRGYETIVKLTFPSGVEALRACGGGMLIRGQVVAFTAIEQEEEVDPLDGHRLRVHLPPEFDADVLASDVIDLLEPYGHMVASVSVRTDRSFLVGLPPPPPIVLVSFEEADVASSMQGVMLTMRGHTITLSSAIMNELIADIPAELSNLSDAALLRILPKLFPFDAVNSVRIDPYSTNGAPSPIPGPVQLGGHGATGHSLGGTGGHSTASSTPTTSTNTTVTALSSLGVSGSLKAAAAGISPAPPTLSPPFRSVVIRFTSEAAADQWRMRAVRLGRSEVILRQPGLVPSSGSSAPSAAPAAGPAGAQGGVGADLQQQQTGAGIVPIAMAPNMMGIPMPGGGIGMYPMGVMTGGGEEGWTE
ncbi:hypothetical protein HDU96_000128 [Phlyctochytrium bullatum]|nr:hypothetical protein HDU96_000128 [Phlyctochytrium bullatum]